MKSFITEVQRLQKLAGITEAKVVPQRFPRPLKGQISAEEWEAIGPDFTTDELNPPDDIIFETPQGFHFSFNTPKSTKLSYEIRFSDYDPDQNVEEWIYDDIDELKRQLNNAGYELEIKQGSDDIMLYIPV